MTVTEIKALIEAGIYGIFFLAAVYAVFDPRPWKRRNRRR